MARLADAALAEDIGFPTKRYLSPITRRRLGAGEPIRHEPVEAHVLFGGFSDKSTVNLCGDPHHKPA